MSILSTLKARTLVPAFAALFYFVFFFFNDTATTEIYTLSLHDALPICWPCQTPGLRHPRAAAMPASDRKSTRLNSSHTVISYAVFCLKKKKKTTSHSITAKTKQTNNTRATSTRQQ